MKPLLIVIGLFVLAIALRSCRSAVLRKSGALMLLAASFSLFFFLSGHWVGGVFGIFLWFMLPWIELLTRVRALRLPMENRLHHQNPPKDSFFPHAAEAIRAMEDADFEHVDNSGWTWGGMDQHFRIFWNPEKVAIGTVCLCEQDQVAFAFVSITSHDKDGRVWRTTNFPFSPTLMSLGRIQWNRVPCEQSCFKAILRSHEAFLKKRGVTPQELFIPDPDSVVGEIENEMQEQVLYNLDNGIIAKQDKSTFAYTTKGLFFLWKQLVRDMIRLC